MRDFNFYDMIDSLASRIHLSHKEGFIMAIGDRRRSALQKQLQGKELSPLREKIGIYAIIIMTFFATCLIFYTGFRTIAYNFRSTSPEEIGEMLTLDDVLNENDIDDD